jgi:hypothetical protein
MVVSRRDHRHEDKRLGSGHSSSRFSTSIRRWILKAACIGALFYATITDREHAYIYVPAIVVISGAHTLDRQKPSE